MNIKEVSSQINVLKIKLQVLLGDAHEELKAQAKDPKALPENTSILASIIPNAELWLRKIESIKLILHDIKSEDAPSTQDYLKELCDITMPEIESKHKAMFDDLRLAKA